MLPGLSPAIIFSNALGKEFNSLILFHRNAARMEKLEAENSVLRARLNSANEISFENKRLRDLLDFKNKNEWNTVAAAVIGRQPENWSSMVLINKGASSGIRNGSVVVNRTGLVGRIAETSASAAKVMLINDPNFSVSAFVQRSRQEGLVTGTLGSNLVMKYLPPDADIQEKDIIVSSGLTGMSPKGLLIGTVVKTGMEFSGLGKYAVISPAADLPAIEEVLVVKQ
ncbi:MAG: rod shape-determining protein MreC [Candidatus Omnitrophota bacterium]